MRKRERKTREAIPRSSRRRHCSEIPSALFILNPSLSSLPTILRILFIKFKNFNMLYTIFHSYKARTSVGELRFNWVLKGWKKSKINQIKNFSYGPMGLSYRGLNIYAKAFEVDVRNPGDQLARPESWRPEFNYRVLVPNLVIQSLDMRSWFPEFWSPKLTLAILAPKVLIFGVNARGPGTQFWRLEFQLPEFEVLALGILTFRILASTVLASRVLASGVRSPSARNLDVQNPSVQSSGVQSLGVWSSKS